jgi:hypothetical protein
LSTQHQEAATRCRRGLVIADESGGQVRARVRARAHVGLAAALLGLGQPREAASQAEQALQAPLERLRAEDRGTARFVLARALWDRDRARARALVHTALEELGRSPGDERRRHLVEVWTRQHRSP